MIQKIKKEIDYFKSFPLNMRYLLAANLIYAFVLPIIEIFVGAYIIGETNNNSLFVKYQLAVYTGIPITFLVNGFLLRRVKIVWLYSFGLLLSGISMMAMMSIQQLNLSGIIIAGLIMGCSYGFFWANRDYMSLDATDDKIRNYYFGLDTLFYTLTFIVVPAVVGYIITFGSVHNLYVRKDAYIIITCIVFLLTIIASIIIRRGKFNNPENARFLYFNYDPLWWKMILLAISKGIIQGSILIFPTMLILVFFKTEESLGLLTSLGGIVAAILLYTIGRFSQPKHRVVIYIFSISLFAIGAFLHSILFSAFSVILCQIFIYMSRPLHDVSYFPVEFRIIDVVSRKEERNEFTYILNHEFALFIGRIAGCLIFLNISSFFSIEFALRYGLLFPLGFLMISIPLMKKINTAN